MLCITLTRGGTGVIDSGNWELGSVQGAASSKNGNGNNQPSSSLEGEKVKTENLDRFAPFSTGHYLLEIVGSVSRPF